MNHRHVRPDAVHLANHAEATIGGLTSVPTGYGITICRKASDDGFAEEPTRALGITETPTCAGAAGL